MKYLLINKKTNEKHECTKVEMGGFDWYFEDKEIETQISSWSRGKKKERVVIATNNSNIKLHQVIDEVEEIVNNYRKNIKYSDKLPFALNELASYDFKAGYNISQKTHPNSDDDMLEFVKWMDSYSYTYLSKDDLWKSFNDEKGKTTKKLFEIWKAQQTKTIYYE